MARTTRSTATQEKQPESTAAPTPKVSKANKKRKRGSTVADDEPASKRRESQPKDEDEEVDDIKMEDDKGQEEEQLVVEGAGNVPISEDHATRILDILETIDTQGLLDRVFPLSAESWNTDAFESGSYSFRTLLQHCSQYPLAVLRSAVRHLLPFTSHPRTRPSSPAAQQQRFCTLALSMLDESSFHNLPSTCNFDDGTLMPPISIEGDAKQPYKEPHHPAKKRNYALVQRLPTGDWWSSVNSDPTLETENLSTMMKDLYTANAELVAILPTPVPVIPSDGKAAYPSTTIPSLGSLSFPIPPPRPNAPPKPKPPTSRKVTCGQFVDYGPYASFAPCWDGGGVGVEVGRGEMGQWVGGVVARRKLERARGRKAKSGPPSRAVTEVPDPEIKDVEMSGTTPTPSLEQMTDEAFDGLLPPEEVAAIKAAMGSVDLQLSVGELLEKNSKALKRLGDLQRLRLLNSRDKDRQVVEGSEEWDTAQGILDSLTLLASFRPRTSASADNTIIPSPHVLHRLHRTLSSITSLQAPDLGYHGILPPTRATALRDDSTVRVKPGVAAPPPNHTNGHHMNGSSQTYPNYQYAGYSTGKPAAGGYTPYKASAYGPVPQTPQAPAYFGQAAPSYAAPGYYPGQPGSGSASRRGTPVGEVSAGNPLPASSYSNFFNSTAAMPQRVVANTVKVGHGQQQQHQSYVGMAHGQPPVPIPPYLRVGASSGYATPPSNGGYYHGTR